MLAPYLANDRKTLRKQAVAALKTDEEILQETTQQADNILNPALTFEKAWNAYLINQERPQNTGERNLKNYYGYFCKFYTWVKENKSEVIHLKDITKEIAGEYILFLKNNGFSPGTYNKHLTFLRTFFHFLQEPAKIENNPFEKIRRLKDSPNSRRELTIIEIKTILEQATGDLQLLLGLGIFTGLRLGDCCTLQWCEIDFETKTIKRIPNKTAKNKKPVTIGIPEILYQKLVEIPLIQRKGFLLPIIAEKYHTSHSYLARLIQKHFKNCGIQLYKSGTGPGTNKRAVLEVGFHSLRHSYISILAKQGISQNVLVKLAGHSQKKSELYTHIRPEDAKQIAANYSSIFMPIENPKVITVEPIAENTVLKNRITKALDYLKTAIIPEDTKQYLLNVLEEKI